MTDGADTMKNWFKNGLHEAWRYWNPENTNSNNANHESSRDVSKYSINDSVDLQHSVITSALWALARSPALVSAVEFEETRDGSTQQLSKILRDLGRDDVLNNVMKLKDAMGDAEAYLAASNIPRFWRMEVCVCVCPRASNRAKGIFLSSVLISR